LSLVQIQMIFHPQIHSKSLTYFAFDTKLDSRFSGSAAKHIEKELINQGFRMMAPRESAIVSSIKERGAIVGARLKEGEEKRFEEIGRLVGTATVQITA
jgi:hypothetical protein